MPDRNVAPEPAKLSATPSIRRLFLVSFIDVKEPMVIERDRIITSEGWVVFANGKPDQVSSQVVAFPVHRIAKIEEIDSPPEDNALAALEGLDLEQG